MVADHSVERVAVLGATGSIGRSALDVAARNPARFRVHALAAGRDDAALFEQIGVHRPARVALADAAAADALRARLADAFGAEAPEVLSGEGGVCELAADPQVDTVVAAVVGAAGLASSLAAADAGKRILLANKEALVLAGALFVARAAQGGARVLPVDSEHNGLFQCLTGASTTAGGPLGSEVREMVLTASGGPFRDRDPATLAGVTPEEACAHPNWQMGRKISVDSATMMNKGLEVIEACHLFGLPPERVRVVVHPQSAVHAVVTYQDGTSLAHLGPADMRVPIAHALGHPDRLESGVQPLDLVQAGRLDFQAPDPARYPCLRLAYRALALGGGACAILNAANEEAVAAFLDETLAFTRIPDVIAAALGGEVPAEPASLEDAQAVDRLGRERARAAITDS